MTGALGRAWLAFSPDEERRAILRDLGLRHDAALTAALARIRRDGQARQD